MSFSTTDKKQSQPIPDLDTAHTGIGLRAPHYNDILETKPDVGFLEAHSENYFRKGVPFEKLLLLRQDYPISLHGVGLSLGSANGLCDQHLQKLKTLVKEIDPVLVSEHISWSGTDTIAVPDLLPLPYTQEAFDILVQNIDHVQNTLHRPILVENPSSYLRFKQADMGEPDFLNQLAQTTGCGLLLDINNIHVSAHNTGFDARAYLDKINADAVREIHLAGYQVNTTNNGDTIYIDAHNHPVYDSVWSLYEQALSRFGNTATLIEWDSNIPPLDTLIKEAQKADTLRQSICGGLNAKTG